MEQKIFHLHAISGLHVGTGQGTGVIDLPIARERATNLPQVPGSGSKGVLRDELDPGSSVPDKETQNNFLALFGPEAGDKASEYAGAIAVGDGRLLALPVRSWNGTFAWASCPLILQRYQRDMQGTNNKDVPATVPTPDQNSALRTDNSALHDAGTGEVFLEDLDIASDTGAEEWAAFIAQQIFDEAEWEKMFMQRFLILPDDLFSFLSETATEIRARIKIEEGTRTVKSGALWYEEYLPAETLLWGVVASDRSRKDKHEKSASELLGMLPKDRRLQIGGNASVGGGQVRWILSGGKE